MSANPFLTALMPISQATGWYLITNSPTPSSLYGSVSKLATFYCLWALYNKYVAGRTQELGHISMGLTALASYLESKGFTLASTALVIANFGLPAKTILFDWDAPTVASKLDKTVTWAYIFKGYFVSNILLWSTVLVKIAKTDSGKKE